MATKKKQHQFPIIIAGAGPCGLVAALSLQKYDVPFVLYERASREKLCSNAGSGFDIAPTALDILENKLGIDMEKAMRPYHYLYMGDMKGRALTTYKLKDHLQKSNDFGFANRARIQNALLETLMENKSIDEQDAILKCSITVQKYTNKEDHVEVLLSDGSIVQGSALLACDGIHSAIRKYMHRDVDDELNYCGQECWWGKTTIRPRSELDLELKNVEKEGGMSDGSPYGIALIGDRKRPGTFFSCEVEAKVHAWVYFINQKDSPLANQTNDLTRRGGSVLTEEDKRQELVEPIANRCKLLQLIVQDTPASDITRAGIFDRKNLDLSFVDGRVALLGDGAHPQSPMMGQGANMAMVDGYVAATILEAATDVDDVVPALAAYDCDVRRTSVNKVIGQSRFYGNMAVSDNRIMCWLFKAMVKYASDKFVVEDMKRGDKPNKKFVKSIDATIKPAAARSR